MLGARNSVNQSPESGEGGTEVAPIVVRPYQIRDDRFMKNKRGKLFVEGTHI